MAQQTIIIATLIFNAFVLGFIVSRAIYKNK